MSPGRRRPWGCAVVPAVLAACLLAAPGAPAEKHGAGHKGRAHHKGKAHKRRSPANTGQLRGAMLTPNWSVRNSPFAMTGTQQYTEVKHVCTMGGDLVRFSVDWSQLQPGGIDQAYLARVDQVMNWAAACRINVILDLVASPCWAIAPAHCLGNNWIFTPPRGGTFGSITRYLLARYPGLYALEVWNEPNSTFWNGTPEQYGALVTEAVAARNAIGSRTKILAGAMLFDEFNYLSAIGFLETLYAAGMRGQDGISIHPYSMACEYTYACGIFVNPALRNSPFRQAIRATRGVMLSHGDYSGIYLTEFGFATCPAEPSCVPEETAAVWLARSYQVAAEYRYVKGLTAFSMRDFAPPSDGNPHWDLRSGILRPDLSPKPAFTLVKSVLSRLDQRDRRARCSARRGRAKAAKKRCGKR